MSFRITEVFLLFSSNYLRMQELALNKIKTFKILFGLNYCVKVISNKFFVFMFDKALANLWFFINIVKVYVFPILGCIVTPKVSSKKVRSLQITS